MRDSNVAAFPRSLGISLDIYSGQFGAELHMWVKSRDKASPRADPLLLLESVLSVKKSHQLSAVDITLNVSIL